MKTDKENFLSRPSQLLPTYGAISSHILTATLHTRK